jgi:hypothetical protein
VTSFVCFAFASVSEDLVHFILQSFFVAFASLAALADVEVIDAVDASVVINGQLAGSVQSALEQHFVTGQSAFAFLLQDEVCANAAEANISITAERHKRRILLFILVVYGLKLTFSGNKYESSRRFILPFIKFTGLPLNL